MSTGFKVVQSGGASIREYVVQDTQALVAGDPVFLENDGGENTIDLAAAGEPILGICMESVTGTSTGLVKAKILIARPDTIFEIDNDNVGDTFGTTSDRGAGNYFNITGASGSVQVDTSTGGTVSATKQLVCVVENPNSSDVSLGWFKVVPSMLQG